MTQRDIDRVVVAIGSVWDSSECERDPAAVWLKIMGALNALATPGPCRHARTVTIEAPLSEPDASPEERCVDCGETASAEPCGICSERFCRCAELNLR